jgi:ABC-type molybdate transport system substrate-binding protein
MASDPCGDRAGMRFAKSALLYQWWKDKNRDEKTDQEVLCRYLNLNVTVAVTVLKNYAFRKMSSAKTTAPSAAAPKPKN